MRDLSNYPPGVTGTEPEIVGVPDNPGRLPAGYHRPAECAAKGMFGADCPRCYRTAAPIHETSPVCYASPCCGKESEWVNNYYRRCPCGQTWKTK